MPRLARIDLADHIYHVINREGTETGTVTIDFSNTCHNIFPLLSLMLK